MSAKLSTDTWHNEEASADTGDFSVMHYVFRHDNLCSLQNIHYIFVSPFSVYSTFPLSSHSHCPRNPFHRLNKIQYIYFQCIF